MAPLESPLIVAWTKSCSRETSEAARLSRRRRGALLRRFPLPGLEQLLGGHVAPHAGGEAGDELARRDVLGHQRAGGDERLLAHLDPGQQDGAAADPGA